MDGHQGLTAVMLAVYKQDLGDLLRLARNYWSNDWPHSSQLSSRCTWTMEATVIEATYLLLSLIMLEIFVLHLRIWMLSILVVYWHHWFQLGVQKTMCLPEMSKAIGRVKRLVSHFNDSCKSSYVLRSKQQYLKHDEQSLIQIVPNKVELYSYLTCWLVW